MARRGKFGTGGTGQNYAGDIRSYIAQSLGTDAVPSQETETKAPEPISSKSSYYDIQKAIAASKPDYSGLDFTGLDRSGVKQLQKTVQSPEYIAARKALSERRKRFATPYTAEEIAGNEYLKALQTGLSSLTYEQALANVRKQQAALNMSLLGGTSNTMASKYAAQQAWKKVSANPLTKYASDIFFKMGGSLQEAPGSKYGGYGIGQVDTTMYTKLGLTAPSVNYDPVQTSTRQVGNRIVTKIANPLNQQQRSRLQRLRSMAPSSLSKKQQTALVRLRAKKNAPTILP